MTKRITDKQLAANRASAAQSTGPRSPEGKAHLVEIFEADDGEEWRR